ncbi:MAG: Mur ligase family protein, partial [Longicatena sp.]
MKLSNLFENAPDIEITGLCIDSRKAKQQDLYFCMDGMVHDGHEFIDDVINKGVKCIVHSKPLAQMKKGIAYIQVEDVNRTLNRVASLFYGHPSRHMTMFGVTGTNGKSTITSIIKDVYSNFFPCGYIGTISISYGDVVLPPSLTTPDPILIHKSLDSMRKAGIKACALEVSS